MTLLGDAADCISLLGEGSSNAIVAAKTLADALAASPDDYPTALAAYEHTHRARLHTFQRRAGMNSHFLVPNSRAGLAMRNTSMRVTSLFHKSSK